MVSVRIEQIIFRGTRRALRTSMHGLVCWAAAFSPVWAGTSKPPVPAEEASQRCRVEKIEEPSGIVKYRMETGLVAAEVGAGDGRLLRLADGAVREFIKSGPLDFNWVDAAGRRHFGTTQGGGETQAMTSDAGVVRVESHFPRRTDGIPCDVTIRYTMIPGVAGVYVEARLHHSPDAPAFQLEQLRFCYVVEPAFAKAGRTLARQALLPSVKALDAAVLLVPPEAMWMGNGIIDCKYDWVTTCGERGVMGVHDDARGLWLIEGSLEYANGGPWKQSLNLHQTRAPISGPVLQGMLHSRHFLDGEYSMLKIEAGEEWTKDFGPMLLLTTNGEASGQWRSATQAKARLAESWPPAWSWAASQARATVNGTVANGDGSPLAGATVLLADAVHLGLNPLESAHYVGRQPWFAAETDAGGHFSLPKVIPGNYAMYVWKQGLWQSARMDGIRVSGGGVTIPPVVLPGENEGTVLWQIGMPDRSGAEFFRGAERLFFGRHFSYREDFPNGLEFVAGNDDPAKAWNWAMLPVPQVNGEFLPSRWRVGFEGPEKPVRKGVLTVALATSSGKRSQPLSLLLNGHHIGDIPLRADTALWFGSTRGAVRSYRFEFEGSLIHAGKNSLEIVNDNSWVFAGVVWDAIKLEIIE